MFSAACPSCGAKVSLRASQSSAAVCGFCRSTLVRDADALRRVGVQGELLEDYSRVQVGTGGRFEGRSFTVVGRIQLRYDEGAWNEWHLLFEDGGNGWLSEASGQYAVTFDEGPASGAPGFEALRPGMTVGLKGEPHTLTDKRTAHCTAAEGELPFPADSRWEARVADLRSGERLLTLDYSDGEPPRLYRGTALALEALQPTLLRARAVVEETAGALPGGLQTLDCPSCGAPVRFVTRLATLVTCKACKSELSAQAKGLVVEVARADKAERRTSIELGAEGELRGERYTVIGILARRTDDDPAEWFEYLLYSPGAGFRWIVQVGRAFQWVEVLNAAPELSGGGARLDGVPYSSHEAYTALTTWVAGSFNWRPRVGDRCGVTEYARGAGPDRVVLSAEQTDAELTWSRAVALPAAEVARAFPGAGAPAGVAAPAASAARVDLGSRKLKDLAILFSILLVLLALPTIFIGDFDESIDTVAIALLALWAPAYYLGRRANGDDDGDGD
jgi:hypothetical protein